MYSFRTYLPYYKRNLKVAFPVMLTQFGAALVGLADSIMVGHYGTTDLAAVSFSNALFFTVMVFSMGNMMGITPLVGYAHGELDKFAEGSTEYKDAQQQISSYFANGLIYMVAVSVFSLLLLAPCIPLLPHFGQEPEVASCARAYYILIVLSIIPFMLFCFFRQFMEGLGNTWVAMVITIGCNVLNIVLNWVLIFGHFGFEPMGATGAGLASLISRALMPICFIIALWLKTEWWSYITRIRCSMMQRGEVLLLFRIGAPIGIQSFAEAFLFTASFIIIGWINKEALAAHHIANQMCDLTFMLALGIGAATTIRVSHQLGKGDLQAVRMASRASIHLCLMMNTIGAAVMIFGRDVIPYIFTNDPAVISTASTLLLIGGLFQYADGLQCVGAAMLRGIQDVRVPMRIAFIAYIVVGLPLGLCLAFPLGLGAKGMWLAFILALAIPAALFHIRFAKQYKRLEYGTQTSL